VEPDIARVGAQVHVAVVALQPRAASASPVADTFAISAALASWPPRHRRHLASSRPRSGRPTDGHARRAAILAVDQLPLQVVERRERERVEDRAARDRPACRVRARRCGPLSAPPGRRLRAPRPGSPAPSARCDSRHREGVDQPRILSTATGSRCSSYGRLVGAEAEAARRHAQRADGMMPLPSRRCISGCARLWRRRTPATRCRVVDPDRMHHHHALVEQAEIVDVADQRLAVLLHASTRCSLGLGMWTLNGGVRALRRRQGGNTAR